jgi:radical SAM-linked protein
MRVRESDPAEMKSPERIVQKENQRRTTKKKVRLKFKKQGELRFLSHLELVHLFYRASKRADLPLCFSEGFHPMPRIVFATALPVGMESLVEIVDVECEGKITPSEVMERLNQTLPPGIEIVDAGEVPLFFDLSSSSHPSAYWIPLDHLIPREEAVGKIGKALDKKEFFIHQERDGKKRSVDIRPLIQSMETKERPGEEPQWGVELVIRKTAGRTAKPIEMVGAVLDLEGEALAQLKVLKTE